MLPSPAEIVTSFEKGTLATKMAKRFGGLDREELQKLVELFASLHNNKEIDLLHLVENGSLLDLRESQFFLASHLLCEFLPELEEPPIRVMMVVERLVARGGADGAASFPYGAFRKWCRRERRRSLAVIESASSGDPLSARLLVFALEASMDVSASTKLALGESGEATYAAVIALGTIPLTGEESRSERVAVLSELLTRSIDDKMRAAILQAATSLLQQEKKVGDAAILKVISFAAEGGGEITTHYIARALWLASDRLDNDTAIALLASVQGLKPGDKATVQALDFGLAGLVDNGLAKPAIDYLTNLLLTAKGFELEMFDDVMRRISADEMLLGKTVIDWLQTGCETLCDGLANLLQRDNLRGRSLRIQPKDIPKLAQEQRFLCRKALGWFFFLPTTAASILVAVLREAEGKTVSGLQSLLVNPLLINYGGVVDYLSAIPAHDSVHKRIEAALLAHKAYLEGLNSVETIAELQPSERRKQIYSRRTSDEMHQAFSSAQKKSIFFSIVHHAVILHGRGAVSLVKESSDKFRAVEVDLATHGISMELPRTEIVDPIGLDYQLRILRMEKLEP